MNETQVLKLYSATLMFCCVTPYKALKIALPTLVRCYINISVSNTTSWLQEPFYYDHHRRPRYPRPHPYPCPCHHLFFPSKDEYRLDSRFPKPRGFFCFKHVMHEILIWKLLLVTYDKVRLGIKANYHRVLYQMIDY